jgi:hypothetical protein
LRHWPSRASPCGTKFISLSGHEDRQSTVKNNCVYLLSTGVIDFLAFSQADIRFGQDPSSVGKTQPWTLTSVFHLSSSSLMAFVQRQQLQSKGHRKTEATCRSGNLLLIGCSGPVVLQFDSVTVLQPWLQMKAESSTRLRAYKDSLSGQTAIPRQLQHTPTNESE